MYQKNDLEVRELTLKNGLSYPSDEELVMLILGSGTKKMPIERLATEVIKKVYKSNQNDLIKELLDIDGIGQSKALAISAALELGKRLNRNPQAFINQPKDIIPYIKHYAMQPNEHFVCITLNGGREILSIRVICTGSGNMAIIKPREIFCEAIKEHASGIILCHNHPGGNCFPSKDDIKTTNLLYNAAAVLGISLLDHIIITKNDYYSFTENDILPTNN
ncbi:MAG: DNA repair protein RadC [Treponema sp.]|nr:DNA repair protein RadC [Treponema sp.]MBQ7881622.1 DNA repair protein RadC [Treponema sp.]